MKMDLKLLIQIVAFICFWILFGLIVVKIQKHYDGKIDKLFEEHEKWMEDFFEENKSKK